ncbi:MAG: AraC family transcriptional regulator ligand-binding domain-containing protein [Sphingomonadales bacterium]
MSIKDRISKRSSDGTVSASAIAAVANHVLAQGVSSDELSDTFGYGVPDIFDPKMRLPAAMGPEMMRSLIEEGRGSAPPLDVAEQAPFAFFSGLEHAILLAKDGRQALENFARYASIFGDLISVRIEDSAHYVELSISHPADAVFNGCCNDTVLAIFTRLMRSAFGAFGRVLEFRTGYCANGIKARYAEVFSAPCSFSVANHTLSLVFSKLDVMHSNPSFDPFPYMLVEHRLQQRLSCLPHEDIWRAVRALEAASVSCVADGEFRMAAIARQCGMSVRSAQRKARQAGTTLGDILDTARLEHKTKMVRGDP